MGLVVVALIGAGCGDDDDAGSAPTSGPVTIETEIDFTGDVPAGTFEVTEGADVLGCGAGAFTDPGDDIDGVIRILICESGSSGGSFSMLLEPQNIPGSGECVAGGDPCVGGPWSITTSTQDFVGLEGEGDMSLRFDSETTGMETFNGTVEFGS